MSDKINEIVEKIYSEISSSERETFDNFFIEYFGKDLQTYANEISQLYKNTSESWSQTGKALEKIIFGINEILDKTQKSHTIITNTNEKLQNIFNMQILTNYNPNNLDG